MTELGELPIGLGPLRTYNGGLLIEAGSELWALAPEVRTIRQPLTSTGPVTFALTLDRDDLPVTLDVSALRSAKRGATEVAVSLLRRSDESADPAPGSPDGATALLDPFVRIGASDAEGLTAAVTVSYTEAAVAAAGISSEDDLALWLSDGDGGWTLLPVASRDADANTITTAPVGPVGDLVLGTTMPVDSEVAPQRQALALTALVPNPTRGDASVSVTLREPSALRVSVVDALGREIAVVHDGQLAAGTHRLAVPSKEFAPGVYALRASAGQQSVVRSFSVVR
ncbi:MAG: T9SS type A sorting domain-containing protein [Bacteroidota bacterium]